MYLSISVSLSATLASSPSHSSHSSEHSLENKLSKYSANANNERSDTRWNFIYLQRAETMN